jgi:hypothetical protein
MPNVGAFLTTCSIMGRRCPQTRCFTAPIVTGVGGWKTDRMMRRYTAVTDVSPHPCPRQQLPRGEAVGVRAELVP